MNDRLIEILERIAKSQEDLVVVVYNREFENMSIVDHALKIKEFCRNHKDTCDTCPLGHIYTFNACRLNNCCPENWDLEEDKDEID